LPDARRIAIADLAKLQVKGSRALCSQRMALLRVLVQLPQPLLRRSRLPSFNQLQ
jgi:hypothetical protein